MARNKDGLTPKELVFCMEYLKDKNATRAYMTAFATKKENSAATLASRLLKKVEPAAFIDKKLKELEEELGFNAKDVLRKFWDLANVDLSLLLKEDGSVKPVSEWPKGYGKLLASLTIDEIFEGTGRDREQVGEAKEIKLEGRTPALVALGRYFKLFKDQIELTGNVGLADRMRAARKRVEGRAK